ncbi:MAG TPA: PhzF family phenazine biosynthesis protein [Terracidiphilus sp.]|nr:PhzF family phenazine biosynthesis protein [Terracidiphilus sp.]
MPCLKSTPVYTPPRALWKFKLHHYPQLDYSILDVFTSTPLAGNPLAVVLVPPERAYALSADHMQSIAREFNLSETTFIHRRPAALEATEGLRVRIFTTQEELPFAGHPTLGTAALLRRIAPELLRDDTITLALNVGPIPVHFESDTFGEMTQRDPTFGSALDPAQVAPLIGLHPDDLDPAHPPQVVSTGIPFAIVLLRSLSALARFRVDLAQAIPWINQHYAGAFFYALAPTGESSPQYRARMQFYGGEDPATGSAAGCAISYLAARRIVPSGQRIHLRQGVEIHRPSDLFLSAHRTSSVDSPAVAQVRVAGSTVLVASGQLFLP